MKAMLQCIGATIQEVVEVNGCALSEPELWSTLRSVSKWLLRNNVSAELKRKNFIITPQKVILLPFGQVAINYDGNEDSNNVFSSNQLLNFANGKLHDNSLMVYSLGLTLLWCAEYNLPGNSPLSISNELLELVSSMCSLEETSFEQVHAVCCQREDVNFSNDRLIISKMCSSILGNIPELNSLAASNIFNQERSPRTNRQCFRSSVALSSSSDETNGSSGKESCLLGKKYIVNPTEKLKENSPQILPTNPISVTNSESSSMMAECNDNNSVASHPINPRLFINSVKPRHGILKTTEPIQRLGKPGQSFGIDGEIILSFSDRSKISFPGSEVLNMTVENLVQLSLKHFMPDANPDYFALATWQDSEYRFLESTTVLSKAASVVELKETLFLRIIYFPLDLNTVNSAIVNATYMQLRDDIVSERIVCSHDDALSVAALALQSEIGDYKTEFGLNYFVCDDFVANRVTSQLGLSYVRSELPAIHRQLAGIGVPEAKILFLRRCQHFDEYGMHFHKMYRLKSCKATSLTWLGVGPHGLTIFDIKGNDVRTKRHTFQWEEMKHLHYKGHKIILTKLSPHVRFKFYQQHQAKAKYIVHLVGKLHQFYGSMQSSNQFSTLALFDDITRLSSILNSSSVSHDAISETDASESLMQDSYAWSYKTPKSFTRNDHVIRRRSSASLSSPLNGASPTSNRAYPPVKVSRTNTDASRFTFQQQNDSPMIHHTAEHIVKVAHVNTSTPNKESVVSMGNGQFIVEIRKYRGSFGIKISGGSQSQSSITMNDDVVVRELVEGGPAISMGTVSVGDRLLAINNVSLQGVTHEEAVTALRNAPPISTLLIERIVEENSQKISDNHIMTQHLNQSTSDENTVSDDAIHRAAVNFYRHSLSYEKTSVSRSRGVADGLSDLSHQEIGHQDSGSSQITSDSRTKSDSVHSFCSNSSKSF